MENPDKLQSFSMALILLVRLRPCAKAVKKQEHHFSWGEEKFPSAFFFPFLTLLIHLCVLL
jgi:hypothetical protein